MCWTRILTPLLGGEKDDQRLRSAAALAAPFGAHMSATFLAATPYSLFSWVVAGAFGHPRFQRFIFGGTTRTLLDRTSGPALFLSH